VTAGGDDRRTELERLASSLLRGDEVSDLRARFAAASFVSLGGDSLLAMALAAAADERMDVTLGVRALMSGTPLGQVLSRALEDTAGPGPMRRRRADRAEDERGSRAEATEPSAAQRGMWLREQAFGPLPYNLVFICFMNGPLSVRTLTAAVEATFRRHDGLRTVITEAGDRLERRVLDSFAPIIEFRACDLAATDFEGHVRAAAAELGSMPFDLDRVPARLTVIRGDAERQALIFGVHHMLLDGWAIGLVLAEIFDRYDAGAAGRRLDLELAVRPEAHQARLHLMRAAGELDRQAHFWRRHLDGAPTVLELPADHRRPAFAEPGGARIPFGLEPSISSLVKDQARALGITTTAFLLAAYGLTLSRYADATTMLIGTPVAGRPTPELAKLVGVTINLVPVRVDVDDGRAVAEYLTHVQQSLALSMENAALPFDEIVTATGTGTVVDRHPLVQAAFGRHDGLIAERVRAGGLDIRIEEAHGGGAQFDVELFIRQSTPSFAGSLEYATGIWQEREAAGFAADVAAAAAELATAPQARLEEVRCMSAERRGVLARVNQTAKPYALTSIDEQFRAQAGKAPDAVAVREGERSLSYAELASAGSAQARLLADSGVVPGSTVLITTGRSIAEVVAALGVVWAGAAYAAVEADTPAARMRQILSALRPAAVIGEPFGSGEPAGQNLPSVAPWPWLSAQRLAPLPSEPDRLAYVGFTSGSAGRPKGVAVPHRGVLRLVAGLGDYAPLGRGDRMLRLSPLSFDASTLELWGALLTGATVEVFPAGMPSAADIGRFIAEREITVAWLTAGLFRLVSEFAVNDLAGMRYLLTGGDVVSAEHVRKALGGHRDLVIINGYGPTENTTFTTVHPIADAAAAEDPLPIGTPVANTQVYLLDRRHRLVPPGAVGELYTAGDGLATGYLGEEELTARAFGEFSPDVAARLYRTGDMSRLDSRGRIQFLGRWDDQVKIRGFRVELAEVRGLLTSHPAVSAAHVMVSGDGAAAKQILAACIPRGDGLSVADLVEFVSAQLPPYMLPGRWAIVPELPLTANGKVDRRALERAARPAADWQRRQDDEGGIPGD